MALPTVVFNSGSGSDAAASGAGPATAVTGTAAAHTGGSASTTITLTNTPDLSGVDTTGLHALWLKTASGRQFSKITAADNVGKTVTVQDSFTIASGSAVNYAIGGKRATWDNADSRTLFGSVGAYEGWTIQTETGQTLTSVLVCTGVVSTADGLLTIQGDSASTRRTITQSGSTAAHFQVTGTAAHLYFKNLAFVATGGTKAEVLSLFSTSYITASNCVFGDATNTVTSAALRQGNNPKLTLIDCEITTTTSLGVGITVGNLIMHGCWVHGCASTGISVNSNLTIITDCLIEGNTGDGINVASGRFLHLLKNCTVHGNTGDGLDSSAAATTLDNAAILNNNFTGNGGFGINAHASNNESVGYSDFNNFGTGGTANTSGARNNLNAGAHDLAVDPGYTATGSHNFAVGTAVKALGFPDATRTIGANNSGTTSYVDLGAAQRQEPAGSAVVVEVSCPVAIRPFRTVGY